MYFRHVIQLALSKTYFPNGVVDLFRFQPANLRRSALATPFFILPSSFLLAILPAHSFIVSLMDTPELPSSATRRLSASQLLHSFTKT